jgi:hypothetical protein
MMHNVRLADPDEPIVKEIGQITAKKSQMTEADRHEVARLKFLGGLYYDPQSGPYLPAANIFKSLIDAARRTRRGKDVEAGVFWLADRAPLHYDGPRDPDKLWGDGRGPFVDRRMVTVNGSRVPGIRPVFAGWSAEISFEYDDTVLDLSALENYARLAGRIGIGDYRRFYGRYTPSITEE